MQFNQDLENCLLSLRAAELVGIPTQAGWMVAACATNEIAVNHLLKHYTAFNRAAMPLPIPVILLADERDLLRYVSALDLAIFDWLEQAGPTVAVRIGGVLGIPECILNDSGMGNFALVRDEFNIHLIKRLRQPLVVLPFQGKGLEQMPIFISGAHTPTLSNNFEIKAFGYHSV